MPCGILLARAVVSDSVFLESRVDKGRSIPFVIRTSSERFSVGAGSYPLSLTRQEGLIMSGSLEDKVVIVTGGGTGLEKPSAESSHVKEPR
jgi:hypothetical protein